MASGKALRWADDYTKSGLVVANSTFGGCAAAVAPSFGKIIPAPRVHYGHSKTSSSMRDGDIVTMGPRTPARGREGEKAISWERERGAAAGARRRNMRWTCTKARAELWCSQRLFGRSKGNEKSGTASEGDE